MRGSASFVVSKRDWRQKTALFWNHMDAWQVALIIAALPLIMHQRINRVTFALWIGIGFGYWFAFVLNDYYDAPHDAMVPQKRRRNYFTAIPDRHAAWLIRLLFGIGVLIQLLIFLQFGLRGFLLLLLCIFIMWAYSAPPLRLESRPGWDILTHALFVQTYVYVMVMLLSGAPWGLLDFIIVAILLGTSFTAQLEQQLRDFAVDAETRRTMAFVVGKRWSRGILIGATAVVILLAAIFVFNGTIPLLLLPYGFISLPALLHRFFRPAESTRSERLVLLSTSTAFLYTIGVLIWAIWLNK